MTGLLEKDIRLIVTRKLNLVVLLLIGGLVTFNAEGAFGMAYMTVLGTILAISTLSYDDTEHGMSFLLTLPCTRKEYVIEKYTFVYGMSVVSWVLGSVIYGIAEITRGHSLTRDLLLETFISGVPVFLLIGAILIPIQLKFGAERSRIVMLGIMGVIFVTAYVITGKHGGTMEHLVSKLDAMPAAASVGLVLMVVLVITVISVVASMRILENKEY